MSNTDKKISEALGLTPRVPQTIQQPGVVQNVPTIIDGTSVAVVPSPADVVIDEKEIAIIDEDFTLARSNITKIVTLADEAMNNLNDVAEEDGAPRAYEVLAGLMKTATEANQALLHLSKQRREMKYGKVVDRGEQTGGSLPAVAGAGITVENAVFVGTTKELDELLKRKHGSST